MKTKSRAVLLGIAVSLFAVVASATNWATESTVTRFDLADNVQAGLTGQSMNIWTPATTLAMCGAAINPLTVPSAGVNAAMWEDWVKTVQAAYLSGHVLRVGTSNGSGTCKVNYIGLN